MDFSNTRGTYVVLDATEINRVWFLSGPESVIINTPPGRGLGQVRPVRVATLGRSVR